LHTNPNEGYVHTKKSNDERSPGAAKRTFTRR